MRKSIYKTPAELAAMVPAGRITALALDAVAEAIRPGVTTLELDAIAERVVRDNGAVPNFALVPGYRHTICASVDDAVVHGIPNAVPLRAGQLVSIDAGAMFEGWNGDSARTFVVPGSDAGAAAVADGVRLSDACERSLWAGIAKLSTARHLAEVGAAVEESIEQSGDFGILEDFAGHGIGRSMHEEPTVHNIRVFGRGPVVKSGLAICIEPMITLGGPDVVIDDDDWTVRSADGTLGAHWEHTILVHADGIWVSTAHDGGAAGLAPFGVVPVPPAGAGV
ncbi:type I methionyl aminopeptidase [Pseudoclavibacter helvolus]|uniref:type I methionyl aminopeptidase n=1 Tax=Pseudoclavibacter helvolus TaxID=255205 RepID=UPI000837D55F|nr:type I methionyl aminopeptidase [Pseudoclavibacter helvolus]